MDIISDVQNSGASPISDRTKRNYLSVVKTAHKRAVTIRTTDWEEPALVSLTDLVKDLLTRTDLAPSTWVLMRSAFLWYIRSGETPQNTDSMAALAMLEAAPAPKRTSQKKSTATNTITQDDLSKLLDDLYEKAGLQLQRERVAWTYRTATWLRCALGTGLRPIEWLDAKWNNPEKTALWVRTAKIKIAEPAFLRPRPSPSQGTLIQDEPQDEISPEWDISEPNQSTIAPSRIIEIRDDSLRELIDIHISFIEAAAPRSMPDQARFEAFRKYHVHCNTTLNRACKRIWKGRKSYTLYTMRGQFSANMKAAVGPEATATLMGHSRADSPATGYYGKSTQAHAQFRRKGRGGAQTDRATVQEHLRAGPDTMDDSALDSYESAKQRMSTSGVIQEQAREP